MRECEKDKGGSKEKPAVSIQPYAESRTSQAETGQDKWQLSTESIGQGTGNRASTRDFRLHFNSFSLFTCTCLVIIALDYYIDHVVVL